MPVKAQRPERCVSTDFTTSARTSPFAVDVTYITVSLMACQYPLWRFLWAASSLLDAPLLLIPRSVV